MKSTHYLILIIISILNLISLGCEKIPEHVNITEPTLRSNNLNISIFLDLSDRISPEKYPNSTMEFYERDILYIQTISNAFETHISNKKLILMDDQMKVFFNPEPNNLEVNRISKELKMHFTKHLQKEDIQNLSLKYDSLPKKLYHTTIQSNNYIGSDIWGFFKEKANEYCIENGYRNILVILTDGYMYHKNSIRELENQKSYLTPQLIRAQNLNDINWEKSIDEKNLGFIPATENLQNLEVIVIGLNPDKKNPYEADVLQKYWSNWLTEMGVKNFKLLNSDLPSNLEKPIQDFILK